MHLAFLLVQFAFSLLHLAFSLLQVYILFLQDDTKLLHFLFFTISISDPTAVDTTDNLALNENQGVSLAGDTVLQALMVTLN